VMQQAAGQQRPVSSPGGWLGWPPQGAHSWRGACCQRGQCPRKGARSLGADDASGRASAGTSRRGRGMPGSRQRGIRLRGWPSAAWRASGTGKGALPSSLEQHGEATPGFVTRAQASARAGIATLRPCTTRTRGIGGKAASGVCRAPLHEGSRAPGARPASARWAGQAEPADPRRGGQGRLQTVTAGGNRAQRRRGQLESRRQALKGRLTATQRCGQQPGRNNAKSGRSRDGRSRGAARAARAHRRAQSWRKRAAGLSRGD